MTQVGGRVFLELRRQGRLTAKASLNLDFFTIRYTLSLSLAESTSYSVSLRGMVMCLRPFRAHPVPSMAFTRHLRATARHALHDDEGVGRFQAQAEYVEAVRVVDMGKLSAGGRTSSGVEGVAGLEHGGHFLSELLQLARVESDFDFRSLHGGFSPVVQRAQHNACDKMRSSIRHAITREVPSCNHQVRS